MAALILYIESSTRKLIQSSTNPAPLQNLTLIEGDLQPVQLYFMRRQESITNPLEVLNYNSYTSPKLRIGTIRNTPIEGYFSLGGHVLHASSKKEDIRSTVRKIYNTEKIEVTGSDGGPWYITFLENGSNAAPTVTNLNLFPDTTVSCSVLKAGGSSNPSMFLLSLSAKPLVEVTSFTNLNDTLSGKSCILDLTGNGIKALVSGKESARAIIEFEITVVSGQRPTVLHQEITILNNVG